MFLRALKEIFIKDKSTIRIPKKNTSESIKDLKVNDEREVKTSLYKHSVKDENEKNEDDIMSMIVNAAFESKNGGVSATIDNGKLTIKDN